MSPGRPLANRIHSPNSGRGSPVSVRPDYPVIAGYRFLQTIARSPRSEVYVAYSEELKHNVCIKVQRVGAVDQPDTREAARFQRERDLLMQVKNKAIVDIYDWGEAEGFHYIVTEYFPAGSLELRVRNLMSVSDSVSVFLQMASALGAVHRAGLAHRDLKPANVMMREDGQIVLIDFGLAKPVDGGHHLTMAGEVRGSPYYISPEQAAGDGVDQRSDLYSLGVMFYEMLTGKRPYLGPNVMTIIEAHRDNPIPRLPENLVHFQKVIDGLLAKNPEQRYPSVSAAVSELSRLKI